MNYGAEPADQVVRYSLEGMEYSLKITGNVAKHVAVFIAAALKDQKKTASFDATSPTVITLYGENTRRFMSRI